MPVYNNTKMLRVGSIWPYGMNPGTTDQSLQASTSQCEYLFTVPPGVGAITRLGLRFATKAGTTPTYKVSLQGITSAGIPDGTIKGGGSPASATFSPSTLAWSNATWHWITLDNAYTPAAGDTLAMVISYVSGTINSSNNASFSLVVSSGVYTCNFPCAIQNVSGTRTRQSGGPPVFGFGSATTAYGMPVGALQGAQLLFSNATEQSLRFSLPAAWGSFYSVAGAEGGISLPAGVNLTMTLYSGTTGIQTATLDSDAMATTSGRMTRLWFKEPLPVLQYGTVYRVGFQTDTSSNASLSGIDLSAAADLDAYSGGQDFYSSSRSIPGGAWSDVTTRKVCLELILSDLTDLRPRFRPRGHP